MSGLKVTMCTGNPGKFRTAQEHLSPWGIEVEQVAVDLDEIQTTSVVEIAERMALRNAEQTACAEFKP